MRCRVSFIGVSGLLISWAICLAISRQALSFWLLAKSILLSSRFSSIRLYSLTINPISSFDFQARGLFSPEKVVFPSVRVMNLSGNVSQLTMKNEINEKSKKTTTKMTRIFVHTLICVFSRECAESKNGMLKMPISFPVLGDFKEEYDVLKFNFPMTSFFTNEFSLSSTILINASRSIRPDTN